MSDADSGQAGDGGERRAPRRRVLLTGLAAYPDLSVSFRCTIRDRSANGARLKLPEGLVVPPIFWMIDVAEGLAYEATAIWRRYPEVGVTLADPIDLQHPERDLMQRRLRALWIEVAPRR
jgi:hypothetical protein